MTKVVHQTAAQKIIIARVCGARNSCRAFRVAGGFPAISFKAIKVVVAVCIGD